MGASFFMHQDSVNRPNYKTTYFFFGWQTGESDYISIIEASLLEIRLIDLGQQHMTCAEHVKHNIHPMSKMTLLKNHTAMIYA